MSTAERVAWRLVRPGFGRKEAFSGEGARLYGGRWNSPGRALVYSSSSLSLAALETLAHAERRSFERDYLVFKIRVPVALMEELAESALPSDWRSRPVSAGARAVGDSWLSGGGSAVLSVPSVIVPSERNYLLNPNHPDFVALTTYPPERFRFDDRL